MKKTKINADIHKNGSENDYLLRLIGNVNSAGLTITPEMVASYLTVRNAIFNLESFNLFFKAENDYTLHISEDGGKTFTLTLTWKEVEELKEINDIPSSLFSKSGIHESNKQIIGDQI